MKKAVKITAVILMGLVILFNILTAVINVAGKSAEYRWLPFTFLTVETGSMEPELSVGDLVIDRDVPFEEIRVGDTVTFRQADTFVTHKVVRKDGSSLITKGVANNAEDKPFGREDYRGKVVASVPKMGKILLLFGSPVSLICLALLLFGLFFGRDIIRRISAGAEDTQEKNEKKEKLSAGSAVKLAGFLTVISLLVLTPTMTQAKYAALVNANTAFAANNIYFTSNFMTPEQTPFTITGWSGSSFGMTITVKNGGNRLQFNKTGQDIIYDFIVIKLANENGQEYRTNYDLSVEPQGDVVPAPPEAAASFNFHPDILEQIGREGSEVTVLGPYIMKGNDDGPITNSFNLLSQSDVTNPLETGESVRYKVYAVTSYDNSFYLNLSSDMTMKVSSEKSFIEAMIKYTTPGSSLLTLSLRTTLMDGSGVKNVRIKWDNTQVYLNEYEKNAFEIIRNRDESYYHPGDKEDHEAYLIVPLTSYSEVTLQFFKYDIQMGNDDISIDAVLDNVTE